MTTECVVSRPRVQGPLSARSSRPDRVLSCGSHQQSGPKPVCGNSENPGQGRVEHQALSSVHTNTARYFLARRGRVARSPAARRLPLPVISFNSGGWDRPVPAGDDPDEAPLRSEAWCATRGISSGVIQRALSSVVGRARRSSTKARPSRFSWFLPPLSVNAGVITPSTT
jgi:hypothetical protein